MTLYLDNSATTPVLPEVKDAMLPYLLEEFGNPSSKYYSKADNAKHAVQISRERVANLVGCKSKEVIFTSGATESNNMIIKGIADYYNEKRGKHIITSQVEHPAVLETCKYLESKGFFVTYLDVDQYGRIDLEQLKKCAEDTPPLLITLIWGNNEIGSLNPIHEVAQYCFENNILFHSDATQVVGKHPIDLEDYPGLRFLSYSAHKLHGPKGIGAAIIREDELGLPTKITPLLHGGEQENGLRSGTLAVHNIVGFGKAAEIALDNLELNIAELKQNEVYLYKLLKEKYKDRVKFNHLEDNKIPGILSVTFPGINNELLVKNLAPYVAVSTGSACSTSKPSHVLKAMGYDLEHIRSTIRISLSPSVSKQELDIFNQL
ncbi:MULTISPECIES: cysteine desulfurase family protein [Allobacillus]|uniref:Aminotransferase class V-fold PLP-dependent enzyme n=1 Tax=Allobacillus salarius TaxID=1955272 RepID=A0A556PBV5_9BACI|nr:aminotransferase class V-fold PLP-dependent enzyme [Allobacillus salarius]TSJ61860.1 aminotransferase class V-fold PLP-dependent enzyme [Allobacillus salarius]